MRYGQERHNETLLRLHERWQQALDDQRGMADAACRDLEPQERAAATRDARAQGARSADAANPTLNRHVDTDGS